MMSPPASKSRLPKLPFASVLARVPAAAVMTAALVSCSGVSSLSFLNRSASEAVVYALGPRENYASPLNTALQTACPALAFSDDGFDLSDAHEQAIQGVHASVKNDKKARLLIAGYAPPNLPADHARSLSERRAQAVRQRFVELGADPASIQTVGFGNDFSFSGPSSGVVVIYRQ